jgi:hypothetical protein
MSWTKPRIGVDTLFDEIVLPLHEKLKRDGGELFPLGPDLSLDSYYITRRKTRMNRKDFEVAAYEGAAGFAGVLRCMWEDETRADLVASAQRQAEVARALGEVAETQTDEISPFRYIMF